MCFYNNNNNVLTYIYMSYTGTRISSGTKIPSPDIFGKALYMFYIGQNDFTSKIAATGGIDAVRGTLPHIVLQINAAIKV